MSRKPRQAGLPRQSPVTQRKIAEPLFRADQLTVKPERIYYQICETAHPSRRVSPNTEETA